MIDRGSGLAWKYHRKLIEKPQEIRSTEIVTTTNVFSSNRNGIVSSSLFISNRKGIVTPSYLWGVLQSPQGFVGSTKVTFVGYLMVGSA
jgi:hypothetical protein